MLRVDGAHQKEQMAHAMRKLTVAVHEVVPPVGLLEAENARGSSQSRFFDRRMERKKRTERTRER